MSSPIWHAVVWSTIALVFAYSVVAGHPLVGGSLAAGIYLIAWLLAERALTGRIAAAFSARRAAVTGGLVVVVVAYSAVLAGQILLGVITACAIFVTAVLTSPTGPLVDRTG
ncbi:hypothetical protein [Halegenticoccus soli]|uniref:hypothetical protein n=1 Tax=Halegenticoccus soli TaxID=1985678 RepID=UPI000C6E605A|nr:hypothetical protein [Halegenticoccus soli]